LLLPSLLAAGVLSLGAPSSAWKSPLVMAASMPASRAQAAGSAATWKGCPENTLPDGDVCVHLPGDDEGGPDTEAEKAAHHDKRGHYVVYDQIPRRPDRPSGYDAYRYPVACAGPCVVSGYDLDRPDDAQRRGRSLSHVGHGGVDIPQRKGEPIVALPLEHQQGDAEVLYVGPLFGNTVVTLHTLREGGQLRDYVLLFGHLAGPAPGLARGAHLGEGDLVGYVGDSGSPELVHLHLEARRVREGVDAHKYLGGALLADQVTVVCDPRNILPLR
jgi:murein DD-endopeptidase MepM/ murein hydrolase activator NlpD